MSQVDQDSDGNVVLNCPHVDPGFLYPEEVSACVIHQLLQDAAQHVGVDSITKAVITVPAYFTNEQREATVSAGRLILFKVIQQPSVTAARVGTCLR